MRFMAAALPFRAGFGKRFSRDAAGLVPVELKGYDHPINALPLKFDQIGTIVDDLLAAA